MIQRDYVSSCFLVVTLVIRTQWWCTLFFNFFLPIKLAYSSNLLSIGLFMGDGADCPEGYIYRQSYSCPFWICSNVPTNPNYVRQFNIALVDRLLDISHNFKMRENQQKSRNSFAWVVMKKHSEDNHNEGIYKVNEFRRNAKTITYSTSLMKGSIHFWCGTWGIIKWIQWKNWRFVVAILTVLMQAR